MGKKSREKKQAGVVGRRRQMIQLDGINRRSCFETEASTATQQSLRATKVSGIGLLGAYQEDSDDDLGTQSPLSGVVMQQLEKPAERIPDNKMEDELAGFLAEINAIGETSTATENEESGNIVAEVYDPQNFDPHTQGHLLPEPWQAVYDESSGYHYFWHCENNEVQWVPPPAPVVQEASFPITPPPPAVPASSIAVKPVGVENEIMATSGSIEGQKSGSLEDTEEELRKKEMSSRLAGLSKKERIKLLLQKNNISTEPASTEPSLLAADNTRPLELKDGDMKAQKNTLDKQENIKVLPEKVRDVSKETKCVMTAVSSLVAGYDSDFSDSQDDNDMEDFNDVKPVNVIHQDTDTVMEPDTGIETCTDMEPDTGIETGMGMKHDTETGMGMETGAGMKHDTESGTVMELDTEPDMGIKTGIGMSMEHYTKPGRGMEPDKEPDTAVESDVSNQGLLVETFLEKGDSNRRIDVFESIQEMGSIEDTIEVVGSNMDNASIKEDTLKEDQSISSNETLGIQSLCEAGDLEKMLKTEEDLIENRKKISVDFVEDDQPVVVRSFPTIQVVVESSSKHEANMIEGMDLVEGNQSSKVDSLKQSGEKEKVDNSTIKGDEKSGKEFSVDIFADESENEEEKNSEQEKNSKQEKNSEQEKNPEKEDFKEEGSSENGESEKEILKDKNIEENETEKDNSIEKVITIVEETGEKKKRGSEKDKEAVQEIKKISKSEEKGKVKNKEKDKEHRSKDKRKRDHKDKRDKHSERKSKEERRERSSKKKHKDKSERSGERSSDRSDRSSRRSKDAKDKAQLIKQEAPQLSKEEQLKQDEEKRKEIEAEVEREERRRIEYEKLKKEEVLKEKERREEEKKNIEEMEKQDAKKKEETENEMNDFAEMLLEGALETDVEVAAAETDHNEAAEDMDISDNDTESFDENNRPPLPPMPPPDERILYPKEEFPNNRNDPECSKYDDETTRMRISDLSRLIFDKLAFLEVARKGLTTFQVMLIEIETRMTDWREGALDSDYLLYRLEEVDAQICKYEETAAPSGWTCQWSSDHGMYYYYSEKKGQSTWSYPTADTSVIQAGPVFGPSQKSSGTSSGTSKIVQPSVTGLENYGYGRTDMMMWRSDIVENRTTETVKKLSALVNNESESSSHDPYRDPYRQTVVPKELSRDISPDKICDSVLSPALPPSDADIFVPVPPPPGEEDEESLPNPWEDNVRSGTSSPLPPGMVATALPTKMLPVKTQMSAVIATDVTKPGADASSATIVQAAARLTSFAEVSNEPSLIGASVLQAQAITSTEAVAGSAAKTDKKKKVKRKKLTTSGLPSKKLKKVSSLVQKWQQVKQKVVEEMAEESSEDEAPEVVAQKRIEEWRRSQLQSGKAAYNPNFEEIKGDWRQRLKKK